MAVSLSAFTVSGTYFCQRLNKFQGLVRLERLGKLKKKFDYIIEVSTTLPSGL
jgi:hypothetical protein